MARVPDEERRHIIDLALKEYSQRSIAAMTGRPLKTVNRICQAYKTEGRIGDAPHRRRPRATTEEEDQLIIAAVADDPFQTANEIMENTGVNAHPATVRNRLKEAGLHSRVAAQKPFLNSTHKTKRLQFAEQHASWTSEEWKRVIFTDESTFCTKQAQRKRVWRLENER